MEKRITAVLIDTTAYHNRQCDFAGITSAMIPMFLRLMETNHIQVLNHPILADEVRKHINNSEIVKRAGELCRSLWKNRVILASVGLWSEDVLDKVSAEKIATTLTEKYEAFAKNFVALPYVDAQEVFADYFNANPPFAGTGEKKSEFPDAFVLKGLLKYCAENPDAKILVISNDSDWKKTLADNAQIQMVNTLQNALTFMWTQLSDKAEFVWRIWTAKAEEVMRKIAALAEDEAFSIDGIDELEDIDISSVRTSSMVGNMTPLEITEDSILVHATVYLSVDGVAEIFDESRSVWDPEDHLYYFKAYSRMTFQNASATAECEVRLGFPSDGSINPIEIKSVRITNKWDICIDVDEADLSLEAVNDYAEDDWRAEQAEALEGFHIH